jgi:hypothetical protein
LAVASKSSALYGLKQRKVRGDQAAASHRRNATGTISGPLVPPPSDPPGRRFSYWLGQRCKRTRELHGLSLEAVAGHVGMSKESIDKFEKGRARPQQEDGVVAGYGELVGLEDARDLYAEALRDWYDHGDAPIAKRPATGPPRQAPDQLPPLPGSPQDGESEEPPASRSA